MKTTRTFKGSWFLLAMVVTIVIGELLAWEAANRYGLRANPLTVGFLCAGLAAVFASVLYQDANLE